MNFQEFKKIVTQTRCTRRFQPTKIEKNDLIDLIDLARSTSSAVNMQPLKYIIITNEKIKEEIYKPLKWAALLSEWEQNAKEKPSAYILIIEDTSINGYASIDSGIAMQTIMLGATIKGFSSCILASIDKIAYKKLFNLNENLEPMFIIALGKSDEEIKLTTAKNGEINYFRDENDIHNVPKRALAEILIIND